MIRIEKLSESAATQIEEIERECFSAPWSEETLKTEINNPLNDFFGAFEEENFLGYIGMQTVSDETSVFNVAVRKSARRQGTGKALAERLISEARKKNAETIFLEVRSGNLPAIQLYEKLGFVFCGIRKNYYTNPTENALLMKLCLSGEQEREDPIECWDED